VTFFVFWKLRKLLWLRLGVIAGALFSIAVMLYKFFDAFGGSPSDIKLSDLGGAIRYGAVGELLGMLAAIAGMTYVENSEPGRRRKLTERFAFTQSRAKPADETKIPPGIP